MAEVPEVETIVRDLRVAVVGQMITGAEVLLPEAVRFPAPDAFVAALPGRRIEAADRRSKHILLPLSGDMLLAVHFMRWGTLLLASPAVRRARETLVVWHLDGGDELRLMDTLGYARTALGQPAEVIERLDLESLGPDALDPSFNADVLASRIRNRRGVLKSVLLNQRIVSGLGNRDADESMWLAQIDPRRPALSLSVEECARLHDGMCKLLEEGLAARGTQNDLFGVPGQAKHRRYIFERTGQPCPRCGTPIAHLRIGGRNTHYCPTCQH